MKKLDQVSNFVNSVPNFVEKSLIFSMIKYNYCTFYHCFSIRECIHWILKFNGYALSNYILILMFGIFTQSYVKELSCLTK